MVQQAATYPLRRNNPDWIEEQMRGVIRVLKSYRQMGDEKIAKAGGYTSRQVFSNRLSGKTPFTAEDIARVSAALSVHPTVLLMDLNEALEWVQNNPNYKPPKYKPQNAGSPRPHRRAETKTKAKG